jgi:hypothetical protein
LTRLRGRSPFGEAKARVSIILHQNAFRKKMDGRVRPGHDGFYVRAAVYSRLIVIRLALNSM